MPSNRAALISKLFKPIALLNVGDDNDCVIVFGADDGSSDALGVFHSLKSCDTS